MEEQRQYQTEDQWKAEERGLDRQSERFEARLDRDESDYDEDAIEAARMRARRAGRLNRRCA